MKQTHRSAWWRSVAVLGLFLLIAAGCSSDSDEGESGEPSPTTEVAAADPAGVVKVGYDIREQAGGGWYFDPTKAKSTVHDGFYYMLYGRLLRQTLDGEFVPDLAESTTIVDGSTIEITLREGLTFSDGTPFDAAAVKAGLERNLAEADRGVMTEGFYGLTGVEVTGDTTLTLTIADGKAAGWHDSYLAGVQTTITKPGQTDFSDPIGAGPFTVTSYQPDSGVTYAKSDSYWDAESITLGGIEIVQVPSDQPASSSAALQAGQVDLALTDATQLSALTGAVELFTQGDPNQTQGMQMCKADGPLSDARVRKAINMGIDREGLGEAVFAGTAAPQTQLWPEGHRFNNPDVNDVLAYDPEAAKQLLADAGYADGFDIDLYVVAGVNGTESAEVIDSQLAAIGVSTNIIVPANYVTEFLNPPRPGMGLFPGNAAGRAKLNQFSGSALANVCSYQNAELDTLVAELATVSDSSDEAVEIWHQIEEIVVNDAANGFILFRSRLAGYNTDHLGAVALWPQGTVTVPDPRGTWVIAGS
ncbi:MAG TPA: ABC transporter substrate-binding protein [Acidimicrobiales bacterium]